jgi:hypothetical protein
MLKLLKGDGKKLAEYLAAWTLAIGAGEFLLNPTVGKLSDTYADVAFCLRQQLSLEAWWRCTRAPPSYLSGGW